VLPYFISRVQVPVYEISPIESSIKFDVESSVAIRGNFNKWDATLTFQSRDVSAGADSVDTGSALKNGKLRGKDLFSVSLRADCQGSEKRCFWKALNRRELGKLGWRVRKQQWSDTEATGNGKVV
jgi:hypothetical protein